LLNFNSENTDCPWLQFCTSRNRY